MLAYKIAPRSGRARRGSLLLARGSGVEEFEKVTLKEVFWGFPGGAVVRNPPANAEDTGSCPSPGRSHMPRSN